MGRGRNPGRGKGPGYGPLVEQRGAELHGAQPVGEGVVQLDQDAEGLVGGALDDVGLPRRPVAVHGAGHQFGDGGPGVRPPYGVDVVPRVEVLVGRPGGAADAVPDVLHALPHPRYGLGTGGEQRGESLGVDRAFRVAVEDGHGAQVHGVARGVQVPEREVQRAQVLVSQGFMPPKGRGLPRNGLQMVK